MIKKCLKCNKKFKIRPCLANTRKYCSYKCYWEALKNYPVPKTAFKKGHITWIKDKHHSADTKKKIRLAHLGQPSPNKGKKFPETSKGNHWNWKKGKKISKKYVYILKPEHPFCTCGNYVLQSRLVAEQYLGRYLDPSEIVHHINLNPLDNRPENLFVFENLSAHNQFHGYLRNNTMLKNFLESNLI